MRKLKLRLGNLPHMEGGPSFLKQNTILPRKNISVVSDAIKIWPSNHLIMSTKM